MPAIEVVRDSLTTMNVLDRYAMRRCFCAKREVRRHFAHARGCRICLISRRSDRFARKSRIWACAAASASVANQPATGEDFESVCFFIAPIGAEDSEQRHHSDAILSSYVEKALSTVEPKLRVVRDKITQPGMITKQVLEYLLKSRLVVADLSYHNPNVFYELAVRHATGKPVIHIKRTSDPLPFDNKDFRTIDIAFDNKFDILAQIETNRSTIAQFSRQSLSAGDNSNNPLLIYFPEYRFGKVK